MTNACVHPECTVLETGRCLLNNDPGTCPERKGTATDSGKVVGTQTIPPPLDRPASRPRFPHSLTLNSDEIRDLTGKRYHRLIGILGSPDAGKTAVLVSLYLLLAKERLDGFHVADSYTLTAFDDISKGARRWNRGNSPEQITVHTEQPDERPAGFLHLRLRRSSDGSVFDLLLPDLPGEWSNELIDHNRTDRLSFLKGADLLWVTLDGKKLSNLTTRQQVLHRAHVLFQRISQFLSPHIPPVLLVISHLDLGTPEVQSIKSLEAEARRFGISLIVANVASFSDVIAVTPGLGICELINLTTKVQNSDHVTSFWPDRQRSNTVRYALRFRDWSRNES
jgi:hypothetical protein